MNLINKLTTASVLTLGLFAGNASAYSIWNNDVVTHTYNFSKYVGSTFVQKAIVKSGTVETDYSWAEDHTEITAVVNTGTCDAYSELHMTLEAELTDPDTGEYLYGSTSYYPPEGKTGEEVLVVINGALDWPEDGQLNLTIDAQCY